MGDGLLDLHDEAEMRTLTQGGLRGNLAGQKRLVNRTASPTVKNVGGGTGGAIGAVTNTVNKQTPTQGTIDVPSDTTRQQIQDQIDNPKLPAGTAAAPIKQQITEQEKLQGALLEEQAPTVQVVDAQTPSQAATATVAPQTIGDAPQVTAATGEVSTGAQVDASQIDQGVGQVDAITGTAGAPITAAQTAEGTGQVDAATASLSEEAQVVAAQGTESAEFRTELETFNQELYNTVVDPRATVQEQFSQLMNFEAGEVPTWAQGALNHANAQMAKRGLTSSTISGTATTSAILQAAMPIAQQDAKVFQTMQLEKMSMKQASVFMRAGHLADLTTQNLQNRQQASVLNAQAALTVDMANLSNEQQARVQNAAAALQVATQNTGNRQQAAIEDARNLLQMDMANLSAENQAALTNARSALEIESQNLNARQQASQFNANAFLQMDMTNLSNRQQSAIVNAQARLQTLMSDTAAANAAQQFNAESENQNSQFYAQMANQTSQFNSAQGLDRDQFNANMVNQRDQFNVNLSNQIEQANVMYHRQINTQFTADRNKFNLVNAQNLLGISNQAMANQLTLLRDDAHYSFSETQNEKERATKIALQKMMNDANVQLFNMQASENRSAATGSIVGSIAGGFANNLIDRIFS